MRLPSLLTAAAVLLAPIAAPIAAQADPRIATHRYAPSEVVTIHGRGDTQSTIAFAPDEHIENVAVGDSAGWQVTPNKRADLLFLKPTRPGARTNMTVVTDRRTYLFDLVSAPRVAPVYMLRFTYPDAPRPVPAPEAAPAIADAALAEAEAPVPADPAKLDPATLNFAWTASGDKTLLPARTFDDGRSTYLSWAKDTPLPAILVSDALGVEGPVNFTTRGDVIVVDGVPARLILRAGKQMAVLRPGATAQASADDATSAGPRRKAALATRPGPYYANLASTER